MSDKTEDRIQQEIVEWYRNNYCLKHHNPRGMIFAVPNQGQRYLTKIGVLAGVSDLIVILPNSKMIFVEVKTDKGVVSKVQREFGVRVYSHDFDYHIIRSLDSFRLLITDFIL